MKKKISIILIVSFISFFIIMGLNNITYGYTATDENGLTWYYTVSGGKAYNVYVSSGTVTGDTLVIPETLGGYPVAGIRGASTSTSWGNSYRQNILNKGNASNTTITKVVIPSTVTNIDANTFCFFTALTEITIPDSVTNISAYAFYCDSNLKTIDLGEGVKTIQTCAFDYCNKIEGTLKFPDSLTSLGSSAFSSYVSNVTNLEIGSGMTSLPNYILYNWNTEEINVSENNGSLSSEDGVLFNKEKTSLLRFPTKKVCNEYKIPDSVTTIGTHAFSNCTMLSADIGEMNLSDRITSIGEYAFYNCTSLTGNLVVPNLITKIEDSTFYNCTGLRGDLIIPDSVTYLGYNAFSNCTGFDGVATIGSGITSISNYAFSNDSNFRKVSLSSSVTQIGNNAFYGISEIWIDNTEGNVNLNGYEGYIHWGNDTHTVKIATSAGIKLINTSTNTEITSGKYPCETEFSYKIQIEDGYNYSDLKFIQVDDNKNITINEIDTSSIYNFERLLRDRGIYILSLEEQTDLSLRTFITQINRQNIEESREPVADIKGGEYEYLHTKYPITVTTGDLITYKIRIYNEGTTSERATKVSMYIPEGLTFDENNHTNDLNGWVYEENGKISTTILENEDINGYIGYGDTDYKDIEVALRVSTEKDEKERLNVIAEIEQSTGDMDSTCGSIKSSVESDYKETESYESTASSYIKGQEDDDDFESVVTLGKVKVSYNIKINKINSETNELLSGATYNLLDENKEIIKTATTDENGVLDFGEFTTYGEGEDIYYIEETKSPDGYTSNEKSKIRVTVTKTIIDEVKGTYTVSINYDLVDYEIDITEYEYVPIKTAEQLQKVGSGEIIEIDGIDYTYAPNAQYKIMNDIDLSEINWTPISVEINSVINGNNHKISNLTITADDELSISEIGLFSVFSGVIQDLELENVNINIKNFGEEATSISGYTGVGAIVGVMQGGYIINCKVSGSIVAETDNVGGFIGHTANGVVKVQKCTNSSTVAANNSASNVGGIIGCALSPINITESSNTGAIVATRYNAGGLVGFVNSNYSVDSDILTKFDEDTNTGVIVIGEKKNSTEASSSETGKIFDNDSFSGEDIIIQKAIFKDCINNGSISCMGATNAGGIVGTSYWLTEIDTCTNNAVINSYASIAKAGGIISELRTVETEEFSKIIGCQNNGEISNKGSYGCSAGGIISNAVANVEIKLCTNTAKIEGAGGVAGILADLHGVGVVENCENDEEIIATGGEYAGAGGIVGKNELQGNDSFSGIKRTRDKNILNISNCKNYANITSDCHAGGIVGEANNSSTSIKNCEVGNVDNKINIICNGDKGGIIGWACSYLVDIENCNVININLDVIENQSVLSYKGTTGGIVGTLSDNNSSGFISVSSVISNCNVTNSNIKTKSKEAAGIIGNGGWKGYSESYNKIYDCTVKNCTIYTEGGSSTSAAGISGGIFDSGYYCATDISNCLVDNCEISLINGSNNSNVGGIISTMYNAKSIIVDCSDVRNSTLISDCNSTSTYYSDVDIGGIIGNCFSAKNFKISNCNSINNSITARNANVGGIFGSSYKCNTEIYNMYNCKVDKCNITGNNCIDIGGIAGNVSQTHISIEKCSVLNSEIQGSAKNVGGIAGDAWYGGTLKDLNVLNTNITVNAEFNGECVAGIAGLFYNDDSKECENLIVNNCKITSGITKHTDGLFGYSYTLKLKDSEVINTDLTSEGYKIASSNSSTSQYPTTCGMIGCAGNVPYLKNCNVENVNITGTGQIAAGVIGAIPGEANITDINVKNVKIDNSISGADYQATAGVVASIVGETTLKNINVDNVEIVSMVGVEGGIFGYIYNLTDLSDSTVNNLKITADTIGSNYWSAGGLGGFIVSSSSSNIINNKVTNLSINVNGANLGGLIGGIVSNKTIVDNCIVDNATLINDSIGISSAQGPYSNVGGLIGWSNANVEINNSTIKNSNISAKTEISYCAYVGGIIGFSKNDATIDNTNVINTNISNETSAGITGGMVGMIDYISSTTGDTVQTLTVTNSSVQNCKNISGQCHIGGILGFGKLVSNTNNITNSTIESVGTTYGDGSVIIGDVGGVIGSCVNESNITDTDIIRTNINGTNTTSGKGTNQKIGGIAGLSKAYITNSKIVNSEISGAGESAQVGGIAGHSSYEENVGVENCIVENSTITAPKGIVGGIFGFSNSSPINSTVTETEIKTTKGGVFGLL